jgi:CheY-like chemotaxis protein
MCNRIDSSELKLAGIETHLTKPVRPLQFQTALVKLLSAAPILPVPELALATEEQRRPVAVASAGRILLAEDNPVNQKVALRQLQKLGYQVDVVGNGQEVLDAMQRHEYPVMLMDCQMPEMDGYEATRRLRTEGSNVWIIAMTANAMQGDREICLAAGMDDYVTKPVRVTDLEAALTRAFEQRQPAIFAK